MGYRHVETVISSVSKKAGQPCGDVVQVFRDPYSTVIIVADGLGSGVQANLAATMCTTRLMELIKGGISLREAFAKCVRTMEDARITGLPYAVFTVARILTDGLAVVLSYEMPPPVFFTRQYTTILDRKAATYGDFVVYESNFQLNLNEGIVIVSDGITQAGLGRGLRYGWEINGVNRFIDELVSANDPPKIFPDELTHKARSLWKENQGDDCTAVVAWCKPGRIINILTGAPADPKLDSKIVSDFMESDGLKIICGATTAAIAARELNLKLEVDQDDPGTISPPEYFIEGMDLVTEGAVTLNQVYNLWDEDSDKLERNSPVTILLALLGVADRVNFFNGTAPNLAESDIGFVQTGILHRKVILPLLAEKLKAAGKLVIIRTY